MDIVPHSCVYIDASFTEIVKAATKCVIGRPNREKVLRQLEEIWTIEKNPNHVLPCLSVRTGFDLFLRVMNFPPGSEIIMSAINIPDMSRVVRHHKLRIVPLDVDLETLSPKINLLESLITDKTKILLLAHVYGKRYDVSPFIEIAHQHNIYVIEDLAEAFEGFEHIGNPQTDIALFSFGVIKFSTAFGGAIAKIRDNALFQAMSNLYQSYPTQSHSEYLKKVVKYFFLATMLNLPVVTGNLTAFASFIGFDLKGYVVSKLRGFPNQMMERLRHQPCTTLLSTMEKRFREFEASDMNQSKAKGDYMTERLPDTVIAVGTKAMKCGYWLFPIVVENPDEVLQVLQKLGVDAYRGATQLSIVEPDAGCTSAGTDSNPDSSSPAPDPLTSSPWRYPHEAKFLIDHVLYLPVHKHVPFATLDTICQRVELAVRMCTEDRGQRTPPPSHIATGLRPPLKLQSKL